MNFTTYSKNGQITGVTNDMDRAKSENYILGTYNSNEYYVRNKVAIKYPPKPKNSSHVVYNFDYDTNCWVINVNETDIMARQLRNEFFKYVDKVNPLWFDELSDLEKIQLAGFRNDLIGITKQPGYPVQIQWPIIPDFLK